jgi:UTP--glucose-1-phosphate uridylyltransferase
MRITQAILPVAGLGTRFLPWTKVVPKELLPLGNKPIIAYIVDECLDAGIEDICLVISHGKELIPSYFSEDPHLHQELEKRGKLSLLQSLRRYRNIHLHVVYQEEMLGDGHAILQAADWVKTPVIAVLFGDDFFVGAKPATVQLIEAMAQVKEKECALIAIEDIPREATARYGVIDIAEEVPGNPRLKRVKGLVEKPPPEKAPSTFGIVGRYLVPASTLAILPKARVGKDQEIRLIDALTAGIATTPVFAYACEGTRIDTGTPEGYMKAIELLGLIQS